MSDVLIFYCRSLLSHRALRAPIEDLASRLDHPNLAALAKHYESIELNRKLRAAVSRILFLTVKVLTGARLGKVANQFARIYVGKKRDPFTLKHTLISPSSDSGLFVGYLRSSP